MDAMSSCKESRTKGAGHFSPFALNVGLNGLAGLTGLAGLSGLIGLNGLIGLIGLISLVGLIGLIGINSLTCFIWWQQVDAMVREVTFIMMYENLRRTLLFFCRWKICLCPPKLGKSPPQKTKMPLHPYVYTTILFHKHLL
jgi:hypothetical protein